jgi:hypothetical protein
MVAGLRASVCEIRATLLSFWGKMAKTVKIVLFDVRSHTRASKASPFSCAGRDNRKLLSAPLDPCAKTRLTVSL